MTFLIDTHTFLWFINGSDELTKTAKELIEKDNNYIFISIASLWEISIKIAIGKLQISGNYDTVIDDTGWPSRFWSVRSIRGGSTVTQACSGEGMKFSYASQGLPFLSITLSHHKRSISRTALSELTEF